MCRHMIGFNLVAASQDTLHDQDGAVNIVACIGNSAATFSSVCMLLSVVDNDHRAIKMLCVVGLVNGLL